MIRVLHVLDAAAGETEIRSLRVLVERLPAERFEHHIAAAAPSVARAAESQLDRQIHPAFRRLGLASTTASSLRKLFRDRDVTLTHAWGPDALAACKAAGGNHPLVISGIPIFDTERVAAWMRQIDPQPVAIVHTQVARARLARAGARPEHIAVIRHAVDFSEINQARSTDVRHRVAGEAGPVILTPGPAIRGAGQFETLWACAMLQQIFPSIRVVSPHQAPETDRLRRLALSLGLPGMLLTPGASFIMPELVAASDVLVAAPGDEADAEPIGWAMAAGVPVIGSARRSVTELLADRSNGLLCINNQPRRIAAALLRLLEDGSLRSRLAETARGQAFDVFSVRAFLDNFDRLYSNIAEGRKSADGVHDTAMVA